MDQSSEGDKDSSPGLTLAGNPHQTWSAGRLANIRFVENLSPGLAILQGASINKFKRVEPNSGACTPGCVLAI